MNFENLTIREIVTAQLEGEFSALDLVYACMERIASIDKSGPGLNAVLELNPDAPAIAASLDAILASSRRTGADGRPGVPKPVGPLHGVPILLKDNIDTGDKLHTSAGSLALADSYATSDAFLVERLRTAGAIILGKANMTEWANFMANRMPNGYSSRGGQVINPYGSELDPGGSSTGSAVAVAAGLCPGAIGTETSGSLLSPALNNMLVTIKPTVGLVSRTGIVPISASQDTAGPLARSVLDSALILMAMRGVDPADPVTITSGEVVDDDLLEDIENATLAGVRIGVPRKAMWDHMSDDAKAHSEGILATLEDMGAIIVDPTDFPNADELGGSTVLTHEFKICMNAYLSARPDARVRTLGDIVAFNREHKREALKYGQKRMRDSELYTSGTLTDPEYVEARLRDLRICKTNGIDRIIADHRLDVIFFPMYWGCAVAARAGYPSITVPTGFVSTDRGDSPYGITFTGPAFSEGKLIRYAYVLEQCLNARRPPDLSH